ILADDHDPIQWHWRKRHLRRRVPQPGATGEKGRALQDRKSTRLNSSHVSISYAVFCLKKKKIIRNGRSASLQRTFKKSFTSFSHSTRNKTRDGLIRVTNIRALNGRFNTSITHAYSIVIGSKHITLNATGGGFLTASNFFF